MREKIKDIIAWAILICFAAAVVLGFLYVCYCIGYEYLGNGIYGLLIYGATVGGVTALAWAVGRLI